MIKHKIQTKPDLDCGMKEAFEEWWWRAKH